MVKRPKKKGELHQAVSDLLVGRSKNKIVEKLWYLDVRG